MEETKVKHQDIRLVASVACDGKAKVERSEQARLFKCFRVTTMPGARGG